LRNYVAVGGCFHSFAILVLILRQFGKMCNKCLGLKYIQYHGVCPLSKKKFYQPYILQCLLKFLFFGYYISPAL